MKAIRIHKFGPTEDVLQYEDVPVPEPKAGEVLIKVEAASLNRADLGLRKGTYRIVPEALPVIPGREFAGTVAKLGAEVGVFVLLWFWDRTGTALSSLSSCTLHRLSVFCEVGVKLFAVLYVFNFISHFAVRFYFLY